jgi:DNA polymerase delta subunit 1
MDKFMQDLQISRFRSTVPETYLSDKEFLEFQLIDYFESPVNIEAVPLYSVRNQRIATGAYTRPPPLMPGEYEEYDENDRNHFICLFGRTDEGYSVCLTTKVYPILTIRCHHNCTTSSQVQVLVNHIRKCKRLSVTDMRYEFVLAHDAGGFYPDLKSAEPKFAKFPFVRLAFKTQMQMWNVRSMLMKKNLNHVPSDRDSPKYMVGPHWIRSDQSGSFRVEVVEKMIPPVLQMIQQCKITPSNHIRVQKSRLTMTWKEKVSHCDLEGSCNATAFGRLSPISAIPDKNKMNRFVVHSYDVEAVCPSGGFPDHENPDDKIVAICATTRNYGSGQEMKIVHGLNEYTRFPKEENVICYVYDTELALLEGWRDHMVYVEDPDMVTGYNTHKFDDNYIQKRGMLLNKNSRLFFFGRLVTVPCKFEENLFESKAYGSNETRNFVIPGRISFDLYTYMKRNFNLDNYKLGTIAKKFLNDDKDDLSIKLMMQYALSGDPAKNFQVMKYCLKDTQLPIRLIEKLRIMFLQIEMSRVCSVFMADIFNRGQMFKVLSQFYIFARESNFVLTNLPEYKEGFQGATVLNCKEGFFQDCLVLDFASLYPSIMIAWNLCFCTWLRPGNESKPKAHFELKTSKTDLGTFQFQQTLPGLLPRLLKKLLAARKEAKKDMKKADLEGNAELKELMNGRQLALKISCNSVYGFTGAATFGVYACPPIAATVTNEGRALIEETIKYVESAFVEEKVAVIYGTHSHFF